MFGAVCANLYLHSCTYFSQHLLWWQIPTSLINYLQRQAVHTVTPGRPEAREDQLSQFLTSGRVEGFDSILKIMKCS